jgi:hypothetical protein
MKRFFLFNLSLMMIAAIAPAAMAQGSRANTATDRNGDGVVSIQEIRLHRIDLGRK